MTKYSKTLLDKIASLVEEDNYSVSDICRIVGVARKSFYNWRTSKPEFAQTLDEAFETREDELRMQARRILRKRMEGYTQVTHRTVYVPSEDDPSAMVIKQHVVTEKVCEPDINTILRLIGDVGTSTSSESTNKLTAKKTNLTLTVTKDEHETKSDLQQVAPAANQVAGKVAHKVGEKAKVTSVTDVAEVTNVTMSIASHLPHIAPASPTSSVVRVNAEDMINWQKQLKESIVQQQQKLSTTTRAVPPPLRGIAYK